MVVSTNVQPVNEITTPSNGSATPLPGTRSLRQLRSVIAVGFFAATVAACGGGGSDSAATTTTTAIAGSLAPTTTVPPTTAAPTTTPIVYVTEGAVVGVANASRINGAAGRLSDRLAAVGFKMGTPTNYPAGQIATTVIFYVPGDEAAQAVAESVRKALGGGAITLAEVTTPPPTETGELGDITVLIAMGNDIADKTLEELQTGKPPETTAAPTTAAGTTAAPTTAGSSTAESSTADATASSDSSSTAGG